MPEMVRNPEVRQEFWRPPVEGLHARAAEFSGNVNAEVCEGCQSEFVMGARFCHVCGAERHPKLSRVSLWHKVRDYAATIRVPEVLGLSTASLVAFSLGAICVLAALGQGLRDPQTVLDWQAVQLWRIQWLLAGIAAFAAGILLKKSSSSSD
ncbi:MAG: hypothetical protein L0Z53_18995 [Acidobacteriales bacterium]|nr:hypothetical protein [Terriglobales bacterium]